MKQLFFVFFAAAGLLVCHCADEADESITANDETDESITTNIEATLSDVISTVIVVTWETPAPTVGRVVFGIEDPLEQSTPLETKPSLTHRALLLGMPADTEVFFRIAVQQETDEVMTEPQSVTTGSLPNYLPDLTAEGRGPEGFNIVPIIGTEGVSVTIMNSDGKIVWYHSEDRGLDVYRARLSLDGESIIYNAASVSGTPSEDSEIVRVSLDGTSVSGTAVPLLAHDFVELPDGTVGAITGEYRDVNGTEIMGNQIVEVSLDGTVAPIFSTWNCFDPETDPGDDGANGWTFANALDYDPTEDVYYLGLHSFSSIVKIDRASGECLWVFGSTAETISFAPGAARFLYQHQFQVLDNGILIFDNDGALGTESRVIEYAFDFTNNTADEVWSFTADPTLYTFVLGEPTRLNDGNTFITWSASGQMNLVTPEKEVLFQLNSPLGNVFGFNTLETSLYRK